MKAPNDETYRTAGTLYRYYKAMLKRLGEEVEQHSKEFESPDNQEADAIIQKYARRLRDLRSLHSALRWKAFRENPKGMEPLGKDQFRCFGCGGLIRLTDEICPTCGWSWR